MGDNGQSSRLNHDMKIGRNLLKILDGFFKNKFRRKFPLYLTKFTRNKLFGTGLKIYRIKTIFNFEL